MSKLSTPLTVHALNRQIRLLLEQDVGEVAVVGELSNLSRPNSGHMYFTLKDELAQLKCAFFRNYQNNSGKQAIANFESGQQVVARGLLSLYEARGDYQLLVHELTLYGLGELSRQFELLKQKLEQQGLFEVSRKRKIPQFPQQIAVITSATGAALQDILTTIARRYPLVEVVIYPSEVQGKEAASQLIVRLQQANRQGKADVIILARGGGSIEDLWAFNDEQLACAIYQSKIPVVTGIGHETDFTIADFVADWRAATPTAAAETVTPHQDNIHHLLTTHIARLVHAIQRRILQYQTILSHRHQQLSYPPYVLRQHAQRIDFLQQRMGHIEQQRLQILSQQIVQWVNKLYSKNPLIVLQQRHTLLQGVRSRLTQVMQQLLVTHQHKTAAIMATLHAVSPLATLARGYAIASYQQEVIYDSQQVKLGDTIEVRLAKGILHCEVIDSSGEGEKERYASTGKFIE